MSVISCYLNAQNMQYVESLCRGKTALRDKRREKDRDQVRGKQNEEF